MFADSEQGYLVVVCMTIKLRFDDVCILKYEIPYGIAVVLQAIAVAYVAELEGSITLNGYLEEYVL